MPTIYCVGSLNLDHVFGVADVVAPGQTVSAISHHLHLGGKGGNQSVALRRAGATVRHIGVVGPDGVALRDNLAQEGIDVSGVRRVDSPSGQAFIQVTSRGESAIVVLGAANLLLDADHLRAALADATPADWLVVQNETSAVADAISLAHRVGMTTVLNASPCGPDVAALPLDLVSVLVVNETEAAALTGESDTGLSLERLATRFPNARVVLTAGTRGSWYAACGTTCHQPAVNVATIDATAAGDTYLGYLVAGLSRGVDIADAMRRASVAAAICVTRRGAAASIPTAEEVDRFRSSE